ncbi:MAG: tetratricopeptide repeat protein [Planctomycetota bacterium]
MNHDANQQEALAHHVDRAKLALAGNLLEAALDHVRTALRLDPDSAEARLLEARIRLRRHEPRLALTALDDHDRNGPLPDAATGDAKSGPELSLLRATALASAGRIEMAVNLMQALAEEFPDDAGVCRALAGMQVHDGRTQDAIATLTRLCELEPTDTGARRMLSDLLAESDPDAALEALGKIDATNRRRAARLCLRADRLAEAEKHYDELLAALDREDQLDAEARLEAAEVAELLGEHDLAIDRLYAVAHSPLSLATTRASAWRSIGRLQLNTGRTGEAGRAYFRATRQNPGDAEAWAGLVTCAHHAGRKGLTRKADARLRSLTERAERRQQLAAVHAHTVGAPGQLAPEAAARSPLQRMLLDASNVMAQTAAKFPERADVHFHRAVCDAARGETADAGRWLDAALRINPKYAAAQAMSDRLGGDAIDWDFAKSAA